MIVAPLLALSFQTRLPLYYPRAGVLDLALLVTVYFARNRRSPIGGLLLGAAIGLAQDCLGSGPIGVFGIVKTIIGYITSSLGAHIDSSHPVVRLLLIVASYYVHRVLHFVLVRGLLD